jgi:hypothetical protein
MDAQDHHLFSSKVVAMAHDNYIRPLRSFPDPANLMGVASPQYGQLQHQHGYAPLVTRIVIEKTFEAPAQ